MDTTPPPPDTLVSYRVPPFLEAPLVEWGPPPPGPPRPERKRDYDLQHQLVRVRFDRARRAVVGSTSIRFAALDSQLTSASFDAVDMRIARVRTASGESLAHDYDGRTLTVKLRSSLAPRARTTVVIDYETVRPKRGVQFVDRRKTVATRGEPGDTRYWVPTYDHPNDRTTWEIHVTTARGERALSNGRLIASRSVDGGTEWHWSMTRPAPTHLMSVVTGSYVVLQDVWREVPIGYWTYPDSVEAAWRGFAATPRMVELFSRRIGVLYPWEKYDQSVVSDHAGDATDGVTATAHSDDRVLHPSWAESHANAEPVVAHALAHQWFGGYVAARHWSDVWLDEGLATFLEAIWAEGAHGIDAGAVARLNAQEGALVADRASRRPLVDARWMADPLELLASGHVTSKAAAVLHMLRHSLGDSLFWTGIRGYTRAHALGNAVTDDFRREMERASGRDLTAFFDQWIFRAGFPTFRVEYAYDSLSRGLGIAALQVQPRDSLTGFFDVDVEVEVLTERGVVRDTMRVRGERGSVALSLPAPPLSIRWDKGGFLLDLADFPRPTVMLAHQVRHDDDLLGRIEAAELLRDRRGEPKAREALIEALSRDSAPVVRVRAAGALETFAADSAGLEALLAATGDADPRVRERAAAALGSSRAPAPASTQRPPEDSMVAVVTLPPDPRVLARLARLIETDSSAYVRGAAAFAYAMLAPESATDVIAPVLSRASWGDVERTHAILALAMVDTPASWQMTLQYLAPGTSRALRQAAIESLAARSRGREPELARELAPLLDADDAFIRAAAARAFGTLGDASAIPALEARRTVEAESRVLTAILGALAALRAR